MTSTFEVMDPATGEKWADAGECTAEETTRAIESAAAAFPSFSRTVGRERVKMLLKLDALIREHKADIAQIITLETGKPLAEAEAEVEYGASFTAWFAGEAERSVGQTIASGQNPSLRYITIKQPIGPVALLVPWNFVRRRRSGCADLQPFALAARKVATALAAGCTSVMKPSPESPFTGLILGASKLRRAR